MRRYVVHAKSSPGSKEREMERQRKVEHLFPELPVQEILQCMEDLRIPLSERDISKPNSAQVQKVFEQFAEIFMGINKDSYVQPQFGAMEFLEHPELHAESLSLITFYRIMYSFLIYQFQVYEPNWNQKFCLERYDKTNTSKAEDDLQWSDQFCKIS